MDFEHVKPNKKVRIVNHIIIIHFFPNELKDVCS